MTFVVALTGGIGSGKSSAASYFSELGAGLVDTDEIAHRLTRPGTAALCEITARFGTEYLLADGGLDRTKLRRHVFENPSAKAALESILHPLIRQVAEREISGNTAPYIVAVVPLLFEAGEFYRKLAQQIVVVDCEEEQQIVRTMARSKLKRQEVRAIMAHQTPREVRLRQADAILDNNGSPKDLKKQVATLHRRFLTLAAKENPTATVCQKHRIDPK